MTEKHVNFAATQQLYCLTDSSLAGLYAALAAEAKLVVPCKDKNGRTNFEQYAENKAVDFTTHLTERSAKDFFFPQVERLLDFKSEGKNLELTQHMPADEDVIVMGVRACDARSFLLLDRVFLHGQHEDTYYKARREHTLLIGMGCSAPEETCFCHSAGIKAAAPETDVRTYLVAGVLYWAPVSAEGMALTAKLCDKGVLIQHSEAAAEEAVQQQKQQTEAALEIMPLAKFAFDGDLHNHELAAFNSPVWDEISKTCLSCCTCTYVCPTCHCYDIRDYAVSESHTQRYRCWDSCMASDFTQMAHGNPRKTKKERFRQRYMHKLVYFPENNDGAIACVGCGRCLDKCPVKLNIVKVAKALAKESEQHV